MVQIHKQYETIVNLSPAENYSASSDAVIMNKLRKVFEGKCYKSSLIIKILRIIRRSGIKPAQNLTDGSADVNVIFEAESIVYNDGDIITNCVVKNVERSGELICKSEYAAIHIRGNVMLRGIQTGQIIPIRVVSVKYSVGKDSITINGTPYFHPMSFFLYKTDVTPGKVPTEVVELLGSLLHNAEKAEQRLADQDPKLKKFFTETFYPFEKGDEPSTSKGIHKFDMISEVKKIMTTDAVSTGSATTMFVLRHPRTNRSSTTIYHLDEDLLKGDIAKLPILEAGKFQIQAVHESYASVLVKYLEEYIGYLTMISEVIEIYDSEEKRQAHKNIWAIYNKLKQ